MITADLNSANKTGLTPLTMTIQSEKIKAATYLLNHPSIQTELVDHSTYTAEKYALQSSNPAIQALVFPKQPGNILVDSLSSSHSISSSSSVSQPISSYPDRFFKASSPAPMVCSYKQTKALELACCIL